ncbi:MAG: ATP-binding protein [Steroidobacter sp.]
MAAPVTTLAGKKLAYHMSTRIELEQLLLTNPFDAQLRSRYAQLLHTEGCLSEALSQYELLHQQHQDHAEWLVCAAKILMALNRAPEALSRYAQARALGGFVADAELDALESKTVRMVQQPLRVISASNVVSFQKPPDERVRFSSIVGMEDLKRTIRVKIIEPFLNPGLFQKFRKQAGGGVMLFGPPGCGKTMLARAVANECNAEFISVGIADILNMWIGESERNLAAIFSKARSQTPCVLFFDEIDALAFARSKAHSEHTRTVVNEFLSQLDGMGKDNNGVLILAATNMPWDVDSAMKRPGRFSRQVFVPPPDATARAKMLEIKLTGIPAQAIDVNALAELTKHFSGADIDGLIELAKEYALEDAVLGKHDRQLQQADFERALAEMRASTLDWLRTARNLVKYGGEDGSYRDVEVFLKKSKLL